MLSKLNFFKYVGFFDWKKKLVVDICTYLIGSYNIVFIYFIAVNKYLNSFILIFQ